MTKQRSINPKYGQWLGIVLAVSALTISASPAFVDRVKVAQVGSVSGNYAQYGAYLRNAVEPVAKNINASGAAGDHALANVDSRSKQ